MIDLQTFFHLMPQSFQGNKSFIAFSNLGDTDSLTKTWKVCTKVAGYLEQGQRLENLSWRLWHLQNLMVDTDNARSKREFKKLSKCMSDKLDKEKGRSIEELEAPGFKRNHSTDIIRQRAAEKERTREANQNARPGTIKRMQFTFSVDQPTPAASAPPVKKPDLKPSAEFRDTVSRRGRPSTRATVVEDVVEPAPVVPEPADKDPPLTQRGRKPSVTITDAQVDLSSPASASLRFPSLFSNDFGPTALLYPSPTVTNGMNYGEDVRHNNNHSESFSIRRPTIELGLDDLLVDSTDSPGAWSSGGFSSNNDSRHDFGDLPHHDLDVEMKPSFSSDYDHVSAYPQAGLVQSQATQQENLPPDRCAVKLGSNTSSTSTSTSTRPSLSVRTQSATSRSSAPGATANNLASQIPNNYSAPGGVKAECSNCGATHTPLWRRGLNDELNCNACGLYCKLHKRPRPKSMRNSHGEGRSQAAPRQESSEVMAQCYNCHTTATPLWRKDDEGKTVCNAFKLHGSARPISMKSDVIRKRSRHDARRIGNGGVSETPSASPGASRRASPNADVVSPILAPDSTTQMAFDGSENYEYRPTHSELVGALGSDHNTQSGGFSGSDHFSLNMPHFPGPYHPDYLSQLFSQNPETQSPVGESSDIDSSDSRKNKRRRMSNDSATDPPSSAVSYSSFGDSFSSSGTSTTSSSQRSSMEYPYPSYSSYPMLRSGNNGNNTFWHPPMLPQTDSPQYNIHPPMLLPEDSPMDFLHPPMLPPDHEDSIFSSFLHPHPPMLLPEDSGVNAMQQPHPPMFPSDWSNNSYNENSMQSF
ncbi:hypothetical protein EW146_g7691 [Bondarzewia mesenterica]|uniref:GATA-type domain-containing protein n=1 Tax=Bondarzewia mesenterica TaxID=1095465 RepID=A0A4S4LK31_9AGAM|nr:hypothetical protein EW146_g7691 [Bondarzewia mesenterica]